MTSFYFEQTTLLGNVVVTVVVTVYSITSPCDRCQHKTPSTNSPFHFRCHQAHPRSSFRALEFAAINHAESLISIVIMGGTNIF